MEDIILLQISERIATITLNRPDKRNALNSAMVQRLTEIFKQIDEKTDTKVVIIKANGPVFSAGADLAYMQQLAKNTFEENLADSLALADLFYAIFSCKKVTIAQVEGHAIAGGCGLATVCDFVFAVPEAKFGYTEVKLGFAPAIVSCFLAPKIGDALTRKLLLTGELLEATEALSYNLITAVTNAPDIHQNVRNFAKKLCKNASANALQQTKKLINANGFANLPAQLHNAAQVNAQLRESDDFKRGIASFLNKEELYW